MTLFTVKVCEQNGGVSNEFDHTEVWIAVFHSYLDVNGFELIAHHREFFLNAPILKGINE